VPDVLYDSIRPMLISESAGQLVVLSTPWGRRGWFYEAWSEHRDEWHTEKITCYDCPHLTPAKLEAERRRTSRIWFASEYECEFGDTVESLFSDADIEAAESDEVSLLFEDGGSIYDAEDETIEVLEL
jgi:hypothetical protein